VPLEARLWPFIDKQPDGHWIWTRRANSSGYGTLTVDGRSVMVHRLVYELLVGPIPERWTIDHLCRIRLCCNPEHLEPVTYDENVRRALAAYKARMDARTHCVHGHPWDEVNTYVNGSGSRQCRQCRIDRRKGRMP